MSTFGEMMMRNTRIVPVKFENRAKSVQKNADGSMLVVQESGNEFTIPAGEEEMQAFVVYTMLNDQVTESASEARARLGS